MPEINRFSSYSKKQLLIGTPIEFKTIFGNEIIVKDAYIGPSKFYKGDAVKLLFEMNGVLYTSWSQSAYIMEQVVEAMENDKFPFYATPINDRGKHTFT